MIFGASKNRRRFVPCVKIAAWKILQIEENAIWKMSTKCQKHSTHCEWKFKLSRGCNWRLQTITCGILVSLTHTRKVGETRHRVIPAVNGSTSYYTACNIQGAPGGFLSLFLSIYRLRILPMRESDTMYINN